MFRFRNNDTGDEYIGIGLMNINGLVVLSLMNIDTS